MKASILFSAAITVLTSAVAAADPKYWSR